MAPGRDSIPVPIAVVEGSNQRSPSLSPDGRWLAYMSNESGRTQVYVRPFPGGNGRGQQVSTNGGRGPIWSPDGRELYYVDDDGMVAATINTENGLSVLDRQVLFPVQDRFLTGQYAIYDIAPDGHRFIMIELKPTSGVASALVMVENLFEGLEHRRR